MKWIITSDRPVYLQLIEEIQMRIISGFYQLGDKLPSVRDLAEEAQVNPNTMQKALSDLETNGLVNSQRTSGRFITENGTLIDELKANFANEYITEFFTKMTKLGLSEQEVKDKIINSKVG